MMGDDIETGSSFSPPRGRGGLLAGTTATSPLFVAASADERKKEQDVEESSLPRNEESICLGNNNNITKSAKKKTNNTMKQTNEESGTDFTSSSSSLFVGTNSYTEDFSTAVHDEKKDDTLGEKISSNGHTKDPFDQEVPSSSSLSSSPSENKNKEKGSSPTTSSSSCLDRHPRIQEMYQTTDWWSLWIGLATFALAYFSVFVIVPLLNSIQKEEGGGGGGTSSYYQKVIPQPYKWSSNPLDAWDLYNFIGVILLWIILGIFYFCSLYFMGKLKTNVTIRNYITGFIFMATLAIIAYWIGRNEWMSKHGLGYAVWAIALGMGITNTFFRTSSSSSSTSSSSRQEQQRRTPNDEWFLLTAKDGEFFIKSSLVLLAVELNVLIRVGGPGMIVSWIGSPIAIILGFYLGMKIFGCKDSLAMLIAVGASWCGASAISAVAPIVSASSEDVSLAISVVAFFTVIFTFVQPYIAMAVGMPDDIAGAWIGGSVDQTGNVIVSAAIISDEATEVASIVKMVLNAGLGIMASVVACYWNSRQQQQKGTNAEEGGGEGTTTAQQQPFSIITLWDKFPKFTLGFLITSTILTVTIQNLEENDDGSLSEIATALPSAISTLNKWWFAIAFVGIGLTTNIQKLWEKAWKSGIIQVYLLANTIDIFLALGLSYLAYSK